MGIHAPIFFSIVPPNRAFSVHFSKRSFPVSIKYLTVTEWILRRESKWTCCKVLCRLILAVLGEPKRIEYCHSKPWWAVYYRSLRSRRNWGGEGRKSEGGKEVREAMWGGGGQGWSSAESTCLPSVWPGFDVRTQPLF